MANVAPLTRYIGEAERTLQALLQRQLRRAGLSFSEWVAMTILSGAASLPASRLLEAVAGARVVAPGKESGLVDELVTRGLVRGEDELALTDKGLELFRPLRSNVGQITAGLLEDLPDSDVEATRRVLETITVRASRLLAVPEAA